MLRNQKSKATEHKLYLYNHMLLNQRAFFFSSGRRTQNW